MRRIVLELADDTTSELCGSCRELATLRGKVIVARSCAAFRATMDTKGQAMRVPDCIAAERTASRLLDVSPEDAAAFLSYTATMFTTGDDPYSRVMRALRDHAKKAEVKP